MVNRVDFLCRWVGEKPHFLEISGIMVGPGGFVGSVDLSAEDYDIKIK